MQAKYEGSDPVGCGSCGGKSRVAVSHARPSTDRRRVEAIPDEDLILCRYASRNRGKHMVYGQIINPLTGKKFSYGYRAGGDTFLVHKDDVYNTNRHGQTSLRGLFIPIEEKHEVVAPEPEPVQVTAPPEPVVEPLPFEPHSFNFQTLPGVTPSIAREFIRLGYNGPDDVLEAGVEGLQEIKGIGETRAAKIIGYLNDHIYVGGRFTIERPG